jgi:hypothetical protein
MKKVYTFFFAVLATAIGFAQIPQKMSYQAVIRNSSGQLLTNQAIGMRISILQGSATGTAVYVETQTPTTNANGLASLEIGGGIAVTGTFATIDWSTGTYFIKTETDPLGGTSYTITGTSQLLSVPYALHAKTVASYPETDPIFIAWNKTTGISITASQVTDFQSSVTNNAAVLLNTAKNSYPTADQTKLAAITGTNTGDETTATIKTKLGITTLSGSNTGDQTLAGLGGVASNTPITGATKTKITYDTKGLVTSGTDATTADIAASTDKNYVTNAQLTVIGNTSGTNTGDNAINTLYSGLVTNATHTGDVTGSGVLTLATVNSNVGTFNNITINAKGLATAGSNVSYLSSEADPTVKAINGIVKSNGTTISKATAGTDYLTPTGSAASLTGFPTLNQNTTGSSASFTGSLAGQVTGTQGATVVANAAVIGKVLTGYVSGAGTITASDNILQAIQKLNGNNPVHYIGESYGGGIVFYVYDNGQHGLIAATANQSTGIRWYNGGYRVNGATGDGLLDGVMNTAIIVATQMADDQAGNFAAKVCADYSVTVGGITYGDWYLPSKYELNLLYQQRAVVGGFANNYYWSSTEYNFDYVWIQNLSNGSQATYFKGYVEINTGYVRAIRAF